MTEYGCSVCGYTSYNKIHIVRHINRKKSCGPGIKEIIEIPVDIICEFCNKEFSCATSLKFHVKNNCKVKKANIEKQLKIKEEENKRLVERVKELEKEAKRAQNVTNNDNRVYINILVNNYDSTNLEKLTDKTYNKIITDTDEPYQIIPSLIRYIHFNPQTPENYNVFLSNRNKNNKHLQIYRNGHWEITNKTIEIDNIIADKETHLSDWVNEKGGKYPEAAEKFNEYLDQKDEPDTSKLVKEEVEFILYNNRHLIRN